MAITKRIRFEILRRDNHTCQYCGASAPDVVLHIDHVMPEALGGSDKADNLVTACKDCNAGKASIDPGSPLVASLGDRAAAYALGMLDKMTRLRATLEEADEYAEQFSDIWASWEVHDKPVELPPEWESTMHRWFRMGVPIRMVELAVRKSMALQFPKGLFGRYRYMCGVVWNQIDSEGIDYSVTEESAAVFTQAEADEYRRLGQTYAYHEGLEIARKQHQRADLLMHHIDGTTSMVVERMRGSSAA